MTEPTVQTSVSLPTREQIAEAHRYQEGDAGDGYTEPREWWASCSCGASLAEWQQFYNESDEDPHKMYALHLADAVLSLLSQPTPTAEPDATHKLEQVRELAAKARWGCERWADPLPVPQYVLDLEAILDPSTIRGVTPPAGGVDAG